MALTSDQREKIFSSLEANQMVTPIIITFVFTGLRSGELISLKWENDNFEKNTIAVKKSIKRVIEFDDKGIPVKRTHELANTKTTQSVRLSCLILWLNICSNGKNVRYRYGLSLTRKDRFCFL